MRDNEYISKEDALKRGYTKRKGGGYYKKNILEKYCDEGYLAVKGSKFSDIDRMNAGKLLAKDYFLGQYNTLHSASLIKTSSNKGIPEIRENTAFHQDRYISAMKSIPHEFWEVVRVVCIENKEISSDNEIPIRTLLSKNNIYHKKVLLSLGLERLVKFYLKKNKKSS